MTRVLAGRYVETYAYADGRLDVRWKDELRASIGTYRILKLNGFC